jgi:glucose/arabinose dehydrogenase
MTLRIFIPALLMTLVGVVVYMYWFSDWLAQKEAVLTLPPGFKWTVFADNVGAARHIAVAPNGDVYVAVWDRDDRRGGVFGARSGNDTGKDNQRGGVLALRDRDGDGRADIQERFGEEGGSGIALRGNSLFFATWTTVYRYELEPGKLVPAKPPEIVVGGFPRSGHSARSLSVDENGALFVNIAAPTNSCQEVDTERESPGKDPCPELEQFGGIWKFDANRKNQKQADGERYATGLRNIVALAWNPADKFLYGVQHGRDHLIESFPKLFNEKQAAENAAEEFFRIERGGDYGHPYCYYDLGNKKKVLAPEYGGDGKTVGRCAEKKMPLVAFPAHWAPISLLFYTGDQFPARYKLGAFVAFHGSWFRTPFAQEGFNVVFVPFQNGQPAENYEVFADGFAGARKHPRGASHRPTGLAQGTDGSLYISDDKGGRIWRITYNAPSATNNSKVKNNE